MSEAERTSRSGLLVLVCVIIAAAIAAGAYYTFSETGNLKKTGGAVVLTNSNFQTSIQSGVFLVDFWAEWCGPCKMQDPTISEIARDFSGRATVAKVDIDNNTELVQQFSISAIPTIIIFKDGEVNKRLVGVQNRETLEAALNAAL